MHNYDTVATIFCSYCIGFQCVRRLGVYSFRGYFLPFFTQKRKGNYLKIKHLQYLYNIHNYDTVRFTYKVILRSDALKLNGTKPLWLQVFVETKRVRINIGYDVKPENIAQYKCKQIVS